MSKATPTKRSKPAVDDTLFVVCGQIDGLKRELYTIKDKLARLERKVESIRQSPSVKLIGSSG